MTNADTLYAAAAKVRERAYAPYSNYRVGAAICDERERIYVGCNVENAAYPAGNCAETSAIAAMIADGGRRIRAIAIVGGHDDVAACTPCGGCRQRISEFADSDTQVWLVDANGALTGYTVDALLPAGFDLPSAASEGD